MAKTLYHYPGCSTCRRARKWLDGQGIAYKMVHLAETPPSAKVLADVWNRSGLPLKKFFNTSGQSYRGGGFKDRLGTMSEDEKLSSLSADGMLIKRPILDHGDGVLVGFREEAWAQSLGV